MRISYLAIQNKCLIYPIRKRKKNSPPLIWDVIKIVLHGFSETVFNVKPKIIISYSYYLHRTALCAAVSPLMTGHFNKTVQITIFDLETIKVVQSLCLMSFWVQGSRCQYLEAFIYILKLYFILI